MNKQEINTLHTKIHDLFHITSVQQDNLFHGMNILRDLRNEIETILLKIEEVKENRG